MKRVQKGKGGGLRLLGGDFGGGGIKRSSFWKKKTKRNG